MTITPREYVDEFLRIVEKNSLRRDVMNWPWFRRKLYEETANAATIVQTHPALQTALGRLGDNHSFLYLPEFQASVEAAAALPEGEINGDISYINIPAFVPTPKISVTDYADHCHYLIASIDTSRSKGWVIDLRSNGGGNMWPMLAGLSPFLPDGVHGQFVMMNGEKDTSWSSRGGEIWAHGVKQVSSSGIPYELKHKNRPVAVLTGHKTCSSGEMVALSLKGLPNVRLFGSETGGKASVNWGYTLPDGTGLILASGVCADRKGVLQDLSILPDIKVAPQNTYSEALKWFQTFPGNMPSPASNPVLRPS